ncbi:MAG TPA: hypothetical protein VFC58_09985 [Desulfosporosinus sp.]|nr:hypothetical protein [Desulfosporosinus sp.]
MENRFDLQLKLLLKRKAIEMKESEAMKEIRKIRDRHYEETKGMTRGDYIRNIKERAARSKLRVMNAKKFGT